MYQEALGHLGITSQWDEVGIRVSDNGDFVNCL